MVKISDIPEMEYVPHLSRPEVKLGHFKVWLLRCHSHPWSGVQNWPCSWGGVCELMDVLCHPVMQHEQQLNKMWMASFTCPGLVAIVL